jgi:hypothetical protein
MCLFALCSDCYGYGGCVFERLRLVLLVQRRRVSSSSEIKSFNLSAIVWLVSLANNETLCADTASIWSSKAASCKFISWVVLRKKCGLV